MNTLIRHNVQAMTAYTPGEQPDDPAIVKLNTNENPYPPSPAAWTGLQDLQEKAWRLYPDPVCRALRESIARAHGCTPDHVICGNGSDEILALCFRAFVETDSVVGYFDPSYSLYPVLAAIQDCRTIPVPLNEDFTTPLLPVDFRASLFLWTNPNAPTSLASPVAEVEAFARRFDGVLVVDEAYADFADEHALSLALKYPHVLVTRSFSKSYSLAGLRLGYAVGHPELIQALYKIKDSYNVNAVTQWIGRLAMDDQAHMHANVRAIRATRDRVSSALREQGFSVLPSQTNFIWVYHPDHDARKLYDGLRAQNILIRYFPSHPATRRHIRITIGTDQQMNVFLSAIKEILQT